MPGPAQHKSSGAGFSPALHTSAGVPSRLRLEPHTELIISLSNAACAFRNIQGLKCQWEGVCTGGKRRWCYSEAAVSSGTVHPQTSVEVEPQAHHEALEQAAIVLLYRPDEG